MSISDCDSLLIHICASSTLPSGRNRNSLLAVPLQAHLVQQGIGTLRIVLGQVVGPLFLVVAVLRIHGRLPRYRQAEEYHLVDLVAIDGQRHRLPEAQIGEDLAQHRVLAGHVEAVAGLGAGRARPQQGLVVALLLAFLVERNVRGGVAETGHVELAGDRLEGLALVVVDHLYPYHVDVGELIARGVDGEVVGVADEGAVGGVHVTEQPTAGWWVVRRPGRRC